MQFFSKVKTRLTDCVEKQRNLIWGKRRTAKLETTDFSIISNNCWGGFAYQFFNLQYSSPTIGLFIPQPDYMAFISDVFSYQGTAVREIKITESKYPDFFNQLQNKYKKTLILGKVKDVEICFLHYSSFSEASEKWERRFSRLSNNIIFKNNDNNLFSPGTFKKWNEFATSTKKAGTIFITNKQDFFNKSQATKTVFCKDTLPFENGVDDAKNAFRKFDFVNLINSCVGKKQNQRKAVTP